MKTLNVSFLLGAILPALTTAAQVHITIPQTTHLSNPASLSADTLAVLSSSGTPLTAPLLRSNDFLFPEVPPGSHLLSVYARDVLFENVRVDVGTDGRVQAWTTWRGNEWQNKGEGRAHTGESEYDVKVEVRAIAPKEYYQERASFSVMSIFKNPMILIAVFSLGLIVGMPYIMDNLDPDLKAEFEEMQKGKGAKPAANPAANLQNMDFADNFASWMAGGKASGSAPAEAAPSRKR